MTLLRTFNKLKTKIVPHIENKVEKNISTNDVSRTALNPIRQVYLALSPYISLNSLSNWDNQDNSDFLTYLPCDWCIKLQINI